MIAYVRALKASSPVSCFSPSADSVTDVENEVVEVVDVVVVVHDCDETVLDSSVLLESLPLLNASEMASETTLRRVIT